MSEDELITYYAGELEKAGISKYNPNVHRNLLSNANFCIWAATKKEKYHYRGKTIQLLNQFIAIVNGIEYIFWNLNVATFGDPQNELNGAPMFVYKNKWIGFFSMSEEKGIRIYFDYNKSKLKERLSVLHMFSNCAFSLRDVAKRSSQSLTSQTNTLKHWEFTLASIKKMIENGEKVNAIGKIILE